ncbi:bacteriocin [Streptococcus suis]
MENIVGGKVGINLGGDIIKVAEKVFAGVCSFLDGWNKKKYTGGC